MSAAAQFMIAMIGVLVVGGIGLGIVMALNTPDEVAGPSATQGPTSQPTQAQPSTPPPTTEPPEAPIIPGPPPDPGTYDPPRLPYPEDDDDALRLLENNPVYGQTIKALNCPVPPQSGLTDEATMEAHLNHVAGCLAATWEESFAAAGWEAFRTPITVYNQPIISACGEVPEFNACYCPADQRIYYDIKIIKVQPKELRDVPRIPDQTLAHEYGHFLQGRSGILVASTLFERQVEEGSEEYNLWGRRIEAQADCLAGMFLGAIGKASGITDADYGKLAQAQYNIGDDVLMGDPNYVGGHGTGASRQAWLVKGFGSLPIANCNTYIVPASEVH